MQAPTISYFSSIVFLTPLNSIPFKQKIKAQIQS